MRRAYPTEKRLAFALLGGFGEGTVFTAPLDTDRLIAAYDAALCRAANAARDSLRYANKREQALWDAAVAETLGNVLASMNWNDPGADYTSEAKDIQLPDLVLK